MIFELEQIKNNIYSIKEEIARYNRGIKLLCATKTIPADIINKLSEFGITDIGENRVQELKEKFPLITSEYNWHLIGALQTNKVKYIIDKVSMIHSVDRKELADEIDSRCLHSGVKMDILVEVNIGREINKSGIYVENLEEFLEYIRTKSNLNLCGLMTVMPILADESLYADMESLYETYKSKYGFKWLSMGMSDDYRMALKYGANIIRIGKSIFGPRDYNIGGK